NTHMRIKLLIIVLVVITLPILALECLPFYNLYFVSDNYLMNSSYAAVDPEVMSVSAIYRNQWADLPERSTTQTLSAQATVIDRLAFGLYVFKDENGLTSLQGINLSAAYHIPINSRRDLRWNEKEYIFSFGLSYNNFQQSLDRDRVIVADPTDPTLDDPNYS